ncbi:sodium/hydrogen exchanger 3 [Spizellomyces punctatus DAOM BR117]|uniref:Sodium/hydrogen exchanger n=1 Tax=Spizellomyces punctatus (strain DAOM BR117) TaxID=645134 RepID=A0A0L0HF31_SPIPD|nr:sodium/hydrogen exchanger 3 [Spizellomyces punctatus DAOM BR117]KNC99631.1 sodium/hydrogen exchanger 3 [Spizellomyces punctatus DAOM BR117]|eukprot:XP_016607671.1 sodium/hydrogen exchanger 3 [Spizellomyces punctatus DAOM BR117]
MADVEITPQSDGQPSGISHGGTAEEEQHQLFVRAILMLSLIAVAMNINVFLHKKKFHYLGETAVYILLGLVVAMGWTAISYDEQNKAIQLSSKFFYMVLLPPIIFEGGFALQRVSFFQNILTITILAFFGALYSTFVTSVLMYFFSKLISPWSFIESLVFGSLISSTDPVTVLSLLPANVDRRLYMIIFGESALNDAVSIILYRFFTSLADPHMRLGVGTFILAVLASAGVFLGSSLVGIFFGLALAKITKHVKVDDKEAGTYEMTMVLIFAYSSYLLADLLSLTGIISVFFTGITMAHYAYNNLAPSTATSLKSTLRMIGFMCECFIFLYLGLGLLSFGGKTTYSPMFVLFACISILISRTHVFVFLGFRNLARNKEDAVPFNQQVLIWFSGLRGAVAFALGVTFLEHPVFDETVKGQIFGTTVMVVVLTVLVLGGLTPYMLRWLGLVPSEPEEGHAGHPTTVKPPSEAQKEAGTPSQGYGMVETEGAEVDEEAQAIEAGSKKNVVFAWLYQFDAKYIRPHFTTLSDHSVQTLAQIEAQRAASKRTSRQPSAISMKGKGKDQDDNRDSDKIELLKSNRSEDVMMEAVNLNDTPVTGDAV